MFSHISDNFRDSAVTCLRLDSRSERCHSSILPKCTLVRPRLEFGGQSHLQHNKNCDFTSRIADFNKQILQTTFLLTFYFPCSMVKSCVQIERHNVKSFALN